jgi:hypothetical protein
LGIALSVPLLALFGALSFSPFFGDRTVCVHVGLLPTVFTFLVANPLLVFLRARCARWISSNYFTLPVANPLLVFAA